MKKKIVLLTTFALVALLVAGGTMAWFTANAEQVKHEFKMGTLGIKFMLNLSANDGPINTEPGKEIGGRNVRVKNTGSLDAYVRVKLSPKWEDNKDAGFVLNGDTLVVYRSKNSVPKDSKHVLAGGWVYKDGYFYYPEALGKDKETPALFQKIQFDGETINDSYQGKAFTLKVDADATQAKDAASKSIWKVSISELIE